MLVWGCPPGLPYQVVDVFGAIREKRETKLTNTAPVCAPCPAPGLSGRRPGLVSGLLDLVRRLWT